MIRNAVEVVEAVAMSVYRKNIEIFQDVYVWQWGNVEDRFCHFNGSGDVISYSS